MLAERRLSAVPPRASENRTGNRELASGIALGIISGIAFAALLLAIGYYLSLDGTRLMLKLFFDKILRYRDVKMR